MLTEPIGIRVLADFASDAVRFELLEPAKVVAWADALIAGSEIAPPWMMDLSLADQSDPLAVCAALREVPGESDVSQSLRLLNGLVLREWRHGNLTIGRAAVPPIATPTSTGNPVRMANTFKLGFSTGP